MKSKYTMKALIAILQICFLFIRCNSFQITNEFKPKLVILIIVDQMRADHLSRFAGVYKYGMAKLLKEGAVFKNTYHDHAYTVTAVGHATISTGAFPSRHGIVGNNWFDRIENKSVYSCEDTSFAITGYPDKDTNKGRSPERMLVPTLGDWLKSQSSESKVFTVACKDRAAILSAGHKADGAYWYNADDGKMITSEFYRKSYPEWVNNFNQSCLVDQYFQNGWTKMMPQETYTLARKDSFCAENDGKNTAFPHLFTAKSNQPDIHYYRALQSTPFADDLIIKFARAIIENEHLGADALTDLLYIGCSAADAIGHDFGPRSQESMDHFLRLDKYLGDFITFLDDRIGPENYIVALSSDHGVMTLPEDLSSRGFNAKRVSRREIIDQMRNEIKEIAKEINVTEPLIPRWSNNALFVNYQAAENQGTSREKLNNLLVEKLKQISPIADIFTKEELMDQTISNRDYLDAYRHLFYPQRSGDLFLRFKKYHLVTSSKQGTSHGTPYDYDSHVPLVFWGKGIKRGHHSQKVRTVDIAPTLAEILSIKPVSEIDGKTLCKVIVTE